jgi:cyclopropane fatty-acyl-phospholipid synthase-like methyltransferase
VGLVALLLASACEQPAGPEGQRFDNAEKWALVFDDPERAAWQKPDEVIRALSLSRGATVADVGSGTGYFAVRLARAVPQGRVLGVDIEPDLVRYLNERAQREGLTNLTAQIGGADDPRLPAPVDLVIVVNTYHHIGAAEQYFRKVRDALGPGGRLAIIDFQPDAPIDVENRVSPEQVKRELGRAGFELTQEHAFLPHQYFLILRPTAK